MPFGVFVSYARNDNDQLPVGQGNGFVTSLMKYVKRYLRDLGPPGPVLWQDEREIRRHEQFDPVIEEGLRDAELLLVVLSKNWLASEYCQKELAYFAQTHQHLDERSLKERIFVVRRRYIKDSRLPPLLLRQEGFSFFEKDPELDEDQHNEFFAHGKVPKEYEEHFESEADRLARELFKWQPKAPAPAASVTPAASNGKRRTVYLAKPAADMQKAYERLFTELERSGYAVVPSREAEIPKDTNAAGFIDAALAQAELSVHALGRKVGYAPEEEEPITKLQLSRTAGVARGNPRFIRLIWAPKIVADDATDAASERDPLDVRAQFGAPVDSDKVDGSELSAFVAMVLRQLELEAASTENLDLKSIPADARVYVYCEEEDADYAVSFGRALQQRKIAAVLPAFDGDPAERAQLHREQLIDCDAVVLCWAKTAEVRVKSRSREWRNWRTLGRESEFSCRALVAGPPPGTGKRVLLDIPPLGEIDVALDLTGYDQPTPDSLEPLVQRAQPQRKA